MSVTTTDNPITLQLQHVLQDYEIRLTGEENVPARPASREATQLGNPPDWPQNYRRVPPYRPIDTNLDREQRPDGTSPMERVFIFTMLHGVWLNAVRIKVHLLWLLEALTINQSVAQAWRKTGGRINSNIFRYKIGGEW